MALREELLPELEELRGIAGELGMRRFQVYVERTVWSGARVGLGTPTTTITRLLVGGYNPKVVQLKQKDVVAGSDMKDVQYEIGPLTPEFGGGGLAPSVFDPPGAGAAAEVHFIIKGPGIADPNGIRCRRTDDSLDKPLRYMLRVRRVGRTGT